MKQLSKSLSTAVVTAAIDIIVLVQCLELLQSSATRLHMHDTCI